MAWTERHDTTDSGQRDGALNDDRTVLFFVDRPANLAFQAQPGLVNRGDAHPRISDVYADEFRVVKQTTSTCEIEGVYTTDGAAYNPNVSIQRLAHKREASFRKVETKIPIIRETRSKLLGAATGSTEFPSFEVDFLTIAETQPVVQIHVTLTTMNDTILQTIDNQDGAIHLIGSSYRRPARFEAGDISQHGPGKWKVLYTWYSDKGTRAGTLSAEGNANLPGSINGEPSGLPNPAVYGPAGNQVRQYRPPANPNMLQAPPPGPNLQYGDTNLYIRSPFHETHFILHTSLPPEYTQFCPFRIDANGWQALPGSPLP